MTEETVLLELHPSRAAYIPSYAMGVFLFFVFFIINKLIDTGLPWLGYAGPPIAVLFIFIVDIARGAESFVISEDGVSRSFQLFSAHNTFIEYEDIEQVSVRQSIFQRIFGIGNIMIESAAEDSNGVEFHDIKDPAAAEALIRRKMDEAGKGK